MQMAIHLTYLEKNIDETVKSLEEAGRLIFEWFSNNHFHGNPSKAIVMCR